MLLTATSLRRVTVPALLSHDGQSPKTHARNNRRNLRGVLFSENRLGARTHKQDAKQQILRDCGYGNLCMCVCGERIKVGEGQGHFRGKSAKACEGGLMGLIKKDGRKMIGGC